MNVTILEGTPYLTQCELREGELRELFKKVYTTTPEKFRDATDEEITQTQERKAAEDLYTQEQLELLAQQSASHE